MHALCHGIDETSASVPFGYNMEWLQVAEVKKLRGNADGLHVSKAALDFQKAHVRMEMDSTRKAKVVPHFHATATGGKPQV